MWASFLLRQWPQQRFLPIVGDLGCSTTVCSACPTSGCWKPQVDETKAHKELQYVLEVFAFAFKDKEGCGEEDLLVTLINTRDVTTNLTPKENVEGKVPSRHANRITKVKMSCLKRY